jgi:hypothetical protein
MERKAFISAAAGLSGILAATSAALAVPSGAAPIQTMAPNPNGTTRPYQRNEQHSNENIRRVRRHLEKVIDELQHDNHDYGGHRVQALQLLEQARQQLLDAEQAGAGR